MRYKEFNTDKVLEDCISLFWKNSFNGTSLNTIVKHTNVNRFSLYNEFENKTGILYESLHLYQERYSNEKVMRLESKGEVSQVLSYFFLSYLKRKANPPGCFIIYIATELGDSDAKVNSTLKVYLDEIESKFIALLDTSDTYGSNAKATASNLILLFCNTMCSCHLQDEKGIQDLVSLNLDIILNK
ncbi:MAG: AcrR family transcriptional regulator [Psychromonas sp.]|jgi:AcrR family transcriptional regulator